LSAPCLLRPFRPALRSISLLHQQPTSSLPLVQAKPVRHKLPDGQSITVHPDEAQRLGEALLQPSYLDPGFDGPDVAESAVISALAHQEPALRKARGGLPSMGWNAEGHHCVEPTREATTSALPCLSIPSAAAHL